MNPTTSTGPELQLPSPVANSAAGEQAAMPSLPLPERAPTAPELMPLPQVPAQAGQAQYSAPSAASQPQMAAQPAVPVTTNVVVPAAADDHDLIEKEWVSKAKQIVEKTRNDPYQQSQELTVFKADYIQKRYNKSIKMSE